MPQRILMVTGAIRSGTTLISRSIDAHKNAICLEQPYMGFFRSYRNALISSNDIDVSDPNAPLADHFLQDSNLLDFCDKGNFNIEFFEPIADLKDLINISSGSRKCPFLERITFPQI